MLGAYFLLVLAVIMGAAAPMIAVYEKAIEAKVSRVLTREAEVAIEQIGFAYWREGEYPETLSDAQDLVPGAPELDTRVRYAIARDLVGGGWTFDRRMVWVIDPSSRINDANYLLNNQCGANSFDASDQWCPGPALLVNSKNDYESASRNIESARRGVLRTLKKFSALHMANQEFPNASADTGVISAGEHQTLAQLVGYVGTAEDCTTPIAYEGIPIECEDMYSPVSGEEVRYHYFDPDHVGLFILTDLRRDDGERILIGHELKG